MVEPDNIQSKPRGIWHIRLIRFASGGAVNLCIRLILVFLFVLAGIPLWLNYALVHLVTLIFAFFYHSRITFGTNPDITAFYRFVGSVIIIRALDYGFVLLANSSPAIAEWVSTLPLLGSLLADYLLYTSIILASAVSFIVRYCIFTRYTFASVPGGSKKS